MLAERFDRVIAVDVSPEMLESARAAVTRRERRLPASSRRPARLGRGRVADTLVCYLVLQHLPRAARRPGIPAGVRPRRSLRAAAPSSSCPCCGAGFAPACLATRATGWPCRSGVFGRDVHRQGRLPRLPADGGRARGRDSRPPACASTARDESPESPYRYAREVFLRLEHVTDVASAIVLPLYVVLLAVGGGRGLASAAASPSTCSSSAWRSTTSCMALLYDAGVRGNALEADAGLEGGVARGGRRARGDGRDPERRLPFRPRVVDWLALAFAALVCLYALLPQDLLDGRGRSARLSSTAFATGSSRSSRTSSGRSLGRYEPGSSAGSAGRCSAPGGARRRRAGRSVRGRRRVVARLGRGRLLPLRARLRLPRSRRPARQLGVQHR